MDTVPTTVTDKCSIVADGVIIAGESYFKRCCDLADDIPSLFSPHFAIANLDSASPRGLFVDNKVHILCSPHMWSRNKINSVFATIYFISAPSVRTCRAETVA